MKKTEIIAMNNRNLRVLRDCLINSKKPYDVAYYTGKIDGIEHLQETLEASK